MDLNNTYSTPWPPRSPLSPCKHAENSSYTTIRFSEIHTSSSSGNKENPSDSIKLDFRNELPSKRKRRGAGGPHDALVDLSAPILTTPASPMPLSTVTTPSRLATSSSFRMKTPVSYPANDTSQIRRRKCPAPQPLERKLKLVMDFANTQDLRLDELIYELFRIPTTSEKDTWQAEDRVAFSSRSASVSKFLRGQSTRFDTDVVRLIRKKILAELTQ
ncbi:hypothetical protein EV360DRAFT_88333 [Lentinula raphanica]|nr:hypothetical protein EV360DRAFT_88333 [Lentinula raphanica]